MSRLSIALCGLSALAIASVAIPAAAAPGGAVSGQSLTNSVGTVPTNASSIDANSINANSISGGALGLSLPSDALPISVLSDTVTGAPLTQGVDPANWALKEGIGTPLLVAADAALKSKGYQGGLAGQGIDPAQITDPLALTGVMPSQGSLMPAQATAELPAAANSFTSLFHLPN